MCQHTATSPANPSLLPAVSFQLAALGFMDKQEMDGHNLSFSIPENPRGDSLVQAFTHLKMW